MTLTLTRCVHALWPRHLTPPLMLICMTLSNLAGRVGLLLGFGLGSGFGLGFVLGFGLGLGLAFGLRLGVGFGFGYP